jgi:hypothetical protein
VCIIALVTQDLMRMRRVLPSSVAFSGLPCFSTLSHKRHDFRRGGEKKLLNIKYVFDILYNFCLKHFSF